MTSLQMPSADIRARAWVRAISARPAGLVVDKEKDISALSQPPGQTNSK